MRVEITGIGCFFCAAEQLRRYFKVKIKGETKFACMVCHDSMVKARLHHASVINVLESP